MLCWHCWLNSQRADKLPTEEAAVFVFGGVSLCAVHATLSYASVLTQGSFLSVSDAYCLAGDS